MSDEQQTPPAPPPATTIRPGIAVRAYHTREPNAPKAGIPAIVTAVHDRGYVDLQIHADHGVFRESHVPVHHPEEPVEATGECYCVSELEHPSPRPEPVHAAPEDPPPEPPPEDPPVDPAASTPDPSADVSTDPPSGT